MPLTRQIYYLAAVTWRKIYNVVSSLMEIYKLVWEKIKQKSQYILKVKPSGHIKVRRNTNNTIAVQLWQSRGPIIGAVRVMVWGFNQPSTDKTQLNSYKDAIYLTCTSTWRFVARLPYLGIKEAHAFYVQDVLWK